MSLILAIDTASPVCMVALANDQVGHTQVVHTRVLEERRQAAQKVLPLIDEILNTASLQLKDLDALAVVNGPGSFTGMRIGVGVAQGLGWATGKPVLPISSLAALAMAAINANPGPGYWLAVQPAREQEIYLALYTRDENSGVKLLHGEALGLPEDLLEDLPVKLTAENLGVVGPVPERKQALEAALGFTPGILITEAIDTITSVCQLAALRLWENTGTELVLPNYVKEQTDYS